MASKSGFMRFFDSSRPYVAMMSLQFGYAGMNIISKISLNHGMSHYVLVVYRHAFATAVMLPFALVLERKVRPKITWSTAFLIFVLGLLGPVIDQNFYYAGLKYTSPTFACAMSNTLPAMTFVMAVLCRMEKVHWMKVRSQAKLIGTLLTVAGAMLMTLYKGQIVELPWVKYVSGGSSSDESGSSEASEKEWLMGCILLIFACLAWAAFFILQAIALKRYSAQISLTALICGVGTLQSIAVTLVMEHNPSAWNVGWDMNLFAAAYAGIVTSGIAYYVQGLVMKERGPVFATAFSPLMMIIVAIMGSFILKENIYLGAVLGSILIVVGLYSVLWGKFKDKKAADAAATAATAAALPIAVKECEELGQITDGDDQAIDAVDLEKANAAAIKTSPFQNSVVLAVLPAEPPTKANIAPRA